MEARFAHVDSRFVEVSERVEGQVRGLDRDVQVLTRHVMGGGAGAD